MEKLLADSDALGAQLWGWIDSLQNSEIDGMRGLTEEERLAQAKEKGEPICERCGAPMALRHSKTGAKFWGCTKYPACGFTKSYQPKTIGR